MANAGRCMTVTVVPDFLRMSYGFATSAASGLTTHTFWIFSYSRTRRCPASAPPWYGCRRTARRPDPIGLGEADDPRAGPNGAARHGFEVGGLAWWTGLVGGPARKADSKTSNR